MNEQHHQVEIAAQLEQTARTLAHSTRDVPSPIDSYRLLAELSSTTDALEQVCRQLADWHRHVVDGFQYVGEDAHGDGGTGTIAAAAELDRATAALRAAADAIREAHTANGVIRWTGE